MPPSPVQARREKERADARLLSRLTTVQSTIDNSAPQRFRHLSPESGKSATLAAGVPLLIVHIDRDALSTCLPAAKQREIEAGNSRLLSNLTRIAAGGASFDVGLLRQALPPPTGSLNHVKLRQEQSRIDTENARLLHNIMARAILRSFVPLQRTR
jgi:hypothetical protein